MTKLYHYYSKQTLENVEVINTSLCEKTRNSALHSILANDQNDKARLFIELFQYSAWRQTQGELLKVIGATKELRGVEFLIRFVGRTKDLPLATKATLGLGLSQTSLAGEFLLSLLLKNDNRLQLEAIKGLAMMPQFHCDQQLTEIIESQSAQDALKINALIAAGRRGAKQSIPAILKVLQDENPDLQQAALLAAGHLLPSVNHLKTFTQSSGDLVFDELKNYIADRIYQRKKLNVEDLIISSISEKSVDWQSRFRFLREAKVTEVRQALSILEESIDPKISFLIRAGSYSNSNAKEDAQFILDNEDKINDSEAAILARLCVLDIGPEFLQDLKPQSAFKLLTQVRVPDILSFAELYYSPEEKPKLSISVINAIVAQSYMNWKVKPDCISYLTQQLNTTKNNVVKSRIIRALGQLNCTDSDYLDKLAFDLGNSEIESSTCYCLSLLPSLFSAPILLAHLEKSYYLNLNVDSIVERISLLGHIPGLTELPEFDDETQSRCALPLLRILSFNEVAGFDTLLKTQLTIGNYTHQMLATRAIAINGNEHHCDLLFSFLNGENSALQTRALHSLCLRGNASQHYKVFKWFEEKSFNSETATLIFNKLRPKENEDYTEVKEAIENLVKHRSGPFIDDEILAAALSLYDNILVYSVSSNSDSLAPSFSRHDQDKILRDEIKGYDNYSETIKIVLRNAELTWQHKELFNHVVDKSTMLVQYSKSTDLLLQQRVGLPIFQNANDAFLSDLQTRIMELGLDTAQYSQTKMIRFLNLDGFFTTREFPAHKLKSLTESILSGKIMADRFRSIDGLRAWSLILLLFARTFVINKKKYSPLIPMNKSGEEKINSIVKLMNKFQDLRNSAAHHGVLVEPRQLEEIRRDSFNLLNELEEALPKS